MLLTFINLGGTEAAILIALILATVAFAAYKALKLERGIALILWLTGIIGAPPLFAIIYLIKTYAFSANLERSTEV